MELDVAAFEFEVGALGGGEDVFGGADREAGVGAGEGDFLVGGGHRLAALALQADLAAGGVQVGAGFLVRLLGVAGLADGEEGDAVLDGDALVALGDQVAVLAAGDRQVLAGEQEVVVRRQLGDAGRGGVVQSRFAPGRDSAVAAARGLDRAVGGLGGAAGVGGFEDFDAVLEGVEGRELLGGGVAFEGGVLFGGDVGQAAREAQRVFRLGDRFAAVEVGAAGVVPGVGADQQAAAGAQRGARLGGEVGAVAAVVEPGVVVLFAQVTELQAALVFGGG